MPSISTLLALVRGHSERGDAVVRRAALQEAGADLAELRAWLASADQPPFAGWPASERVRGINARQRLIAKLEAAE
jgi:hypothetical protein